MFHYQIYGLRVLSDIELPELLPANDSAACSTPPKVDITIRLGDVSDSGIVGGVEVEDGCQINQDQFWLQIPDVARFHAQAGHAVTVEPLPGSDAASIRLFLLGSCIGALLHQRGFLVLHGNAVRVGNACLVFVGDSGVGKSSLAAAFLQQGHQILADDVVPITSDGLAIPGMPRIKLWQETADALGLSTQGLRRIRPDMDKFDYPLGELFCREALPVRWVCALNVGGDGAITIQDVVGAERFKILRDNTYRMHFAQGMGRQAAHLGQCANLSKQVLIKKLTRPQHGTTPGDLVRFIRQADKA